MLLNFVGDNAVHIYDQNLDNIRKVMGEFVCFSSTLLVGFRV